VVLAAFADPHAAQGGAGEAAVVVPPKIAETGLHPRRVVGDPQPEVLVGAVGVDHLAGVHLAVRVPDRLEFPERLHQLLAVHLGQQLGARLAVAVLAGERAAHREHQVRGLVDEAAVLLDAGGGDEVEVDPGVDAALAEMAVEGALVAILVEQLAQGAQVIPDPLRRDRGVLPARPGVRLAGHPGGGAQAGLADGPDRLLLLGVVEDLARRRARLALECLDQRAGLPLGFLPRLAAEFDQQPAAPLGQQVDVLRVELLPLHVGDQHVVQPLEADRPVRHDLGHVVAGRVNVRITEHDQTAGRRAGDEAQGGLQDGDAGPLGAHQRAGHVETVLGQELRQVVAGDPARDVRKALADLVRVAVAQIAQPAVDLPPAPAGADDPLQLLLAGGPHPQAQAVVGEHLQLLDVLLGLAGHHRVDAAGVVPHHAAEGAVVVGGGVGAEGEVVALGRVAQLVQHQARLDTRPAAVRINMEDAVQIFREVEHHRHVAALAGEAGAAAAGQHGRAVLAAGGEGLDHVLLRAGDHHADRHLAVVRGIGGIEGAAAGVEAHLPLDGGAEVGGERLGVFEIRSLGTARRRDGSRRGLDRFGMGIDVGYGHGVLLSRCRVGDGGKEGVVGLPGVEAGVLGHHRHVGFDHAGVIRVFRNGLGIGEIVEAHVAGAPGRDGDFIRSGRIAVGKIDRDLDVGVAVAGVEQADRLVADHLRLRPVAPGRDVPLGDRPAGGSDVLMFHDG
jgi:hypothetical protein